MSIINPTLPNDGETVDAQDVNGPFNAILGLLNGNLDDTNIKPGSLPWSVMANFTNSIPASAMTNSGNLELFRQHSNISFIATGLVWSALTGLNAGMTLGKYYSNNGNLLSITAISSRTFTASKDTYVSIAQNGAIAYSEVANNAAMPSLPSNSNWLAKVVTSGAAVTSVTDMRQTAPIASHNVDWTTFPSFKYNRTTARNTTALNWTTLGCENQLWDNTAGAYSNASNAGIFTAPMAGIYRFNMAAYLGSTTATHGALRLTINGSDNQEYQNLSASRIFNLQASVELKLAKGDTVQPYVYSNAVCDLNRPMDTWFSGKLIAL